MTNALNYNFINSIFPWRQVFFALLFSLAVVLTINSQSIATEKEVLVIDEVKDGEIFAFGKTVIVRKEAKGVLVFGGDIIVEGRIEEEAATIGGSVYQKEAGFIGGDVIVFGGKYEHERKEPLRNFGKETIMYAGYEEELKSLTQNPTQLFAPSLTWTYLLQRLVSTLFWFIVALFLTTLAPGAISRAVARFQLSTLKVVGIGFLAFMTMTLGVIVGFSFLPSYISGIIGLMASLLMILAYVYGRISLQVIGGKWLQKQFLNDSSRSETIALLLGTILWTFLTSLPYVGTLAVLLIFAASLGLVITSRSPNTWQKS